MPNKNFQIDRLTRIEAQNKKISRESEKSKERPNT
jgi:hypothetical protein